MKCVALFKRTIMNTLFKLPAKSFFSGLKRPQTEIRRNARKNSSIVLGILSLFILTFLVATPTFSQEKVTRKIDSKEVQLRKERGKIIKGNVADATGALPGANVTLKGTKRGTETDFDGNFEFPLQLLEGDVLVFEYLGFEKKEVMIKKDTKFLRVKMKETTEVLEIVVLDEPQTKKLHKSKKSAFKKKKNKE